MIAALREICSGFYAANDKRTPALLGFSSAVVFVGVALALRGRLGQPAISAAIAVSSAAQLIVAIPLLMRTLRTLKAGPILASAARTVAASLFALAIAASCAWALTLGAGADPLSRLLPGTAGVVLFTATFLCAARVLGSPELELVLHSLQRRRKHG
jgi:peptidoglycan biosynthesis protein MviN/MurJ (putative lipid II flippase)